MIGAVDNMIFVVVPAYNVETKIGRVIRGLFEHGFKNVVVVDDGSTDNTIDEIQNSQAIVLRHMVNRGQGAALQTGNEYALSQGAELVVHFDGDGQFNPADINGAIEKMRQNGYDIIFGSRFLDNRSRLPLIKRHLVLPVSRIVNRLLTGVRLSDAHNGFRVMNRKALEKIKITQDRMAHNSEIVAETRRQGLNFGEHPVEVIYFEYGQKVIGGFKTVWDIIFKKISN